MFSLRSNTSKPGRYVEKKMKNDILTTELINGSQVKLLINNIPLLDIVKNEEIPYSLQEFKEHQRDESFTESDPKYLAGQYMNMMIHDTYFPNKNLLGQPRETDYVIDKSDPLKEKSTLLYCDCGITDCWLFMCKITINENTVTWSDFEHFHRDWKYNFGPYTFDKTEYLKQLKANT